MEHVAIGNRASRRQRSYGSWRKHEAVRVINVKVARVAMGDSAKTGPQIRAICVIRG